MSGKCWAVAAAIVLLAAAEAFAQAPAPSNAAATQPLPADGKPQWPVTLPDKAGVETAPVAWSAQEVQLAQARCNVLLKNIAAVAVQEAPLRERSECGAPAPMRLTSVGKIAFSPPPLVTCELIAALAEWLDRDVQPLARKHLGAPIARIETMSSYSCRNAYGRARGRVSEHGKANALDIGSFVTARGQAAMVIADWGPTARQIAAEAAADAIEEQRAGSRTSVQGGPTPAPQRNSPVAAPGGQKPPVAAATLLPLELRAGVVIPGITLDTPGGGQGEPAFGLGAPPSRLGGPKPAGAAGPDAANAATANADGKTDFLRAVHRAACKRFNTALGPEANKAHLNHFHIDMAERIKNTKVCE
jgi:hypothetical protein